MATLVHVDAASTNRSLADRAQRNSKRPLVINGQQAYCDPKLLFWRRYIDHAVDDAKRTVHGLPSDLAILARWWLSENRPTPDQKDEWECSFAAGCGWLNLDVEEERARLLAEIDEALRNALEAHARGYLYVRRAHVLTCAGMPTAIAGRYVLPLVAKAEYDDVAGTDHPDPLNAMEPLLAPLRA